MPVTAAESALPADVTLLELKRTARITGLLYLGLAITGMLGFLLVRAQIFIGADPRATLANLTEHGLLARLGIALELGIVLTQALAAVWFYRLFRSVDSFAAGTLAAFGLINAVVILGSAALIMTAFEIAGNATMFAAGFAADEAQLLYVVSGNLWSVGSIFFGLWLIPMGWLVRRSGWLPRPLGLILIAGGIGYVLNAFVTSLLPEASSIAGLLTVPATIGEFWIVGYLIAYGVRERT